MEKHDDDENLFHIAIIYRPISCVSLHEFFTHIHSFINFTLQFSWLDASLLTLFFVCGLSLMKN